MLKKRLYNHCKKMIIEKLEELEQREKDLQIALTSENKSSVGDKHETGRAMIHLEREKLGQQIAESELNLQKLIPLKNHFGAEIISLGSVVHTDKGNYYLSISVKSCQINLKNYYCISCQSPIGKLLLGKKMDDQINFNENLSTILEIK